MCLFLHGSTAARRVTPTTYAHGVTACTGGMGGSNHAASTRQRGTTGTSRPLARSLARPHSLTVSRHDGVWVFYYVDWRHVHADGTLAPGARRRGVGGGDELGRRRVNVWRTQTDGRIDGGPCNQTPSCCRLVERWRQTCRRRW